MPWCPLPALPVKVMAVHHQGRAVLQAAVCERHPGLAEPRALKGGSQKADWEFYDLSKGRLWGLW